MHRSITVLLAVLLPLAFEESMQQKQATDYKLKHQCSYMFETNTNSVNCSSMCLLELPEFPLNASAIDFSYNGLQELRTPNSLPRSTKRLDLSNNNITWIELGAFDKLINLEWLNLNSNNLAYTDQVLLPGLFRCLAKLHTLDIKDNCKHCDTVPNITTYPEALSTLTNLVSIRLDTHKSAMFPAYYKQLRRLKHIDMHCKIRSDNGNCKDGDGYCYSINELRSDLFTGTPYLESVDISGCNITTIGSGTFQILRNLRFLNVSENRRLSFRALKNITTGLHNTKIDILNASRLHCTLGIGSMLYKDDFEDLAKTNLTELYLDENRLTQLDDDALSSFPESLKILSLRNNQLQVGSYINFVYKLKHLQYLDISHHPARNPTLHEMNTFFSCHDFRGDPPKKDEKSRRLYSNEKSFLFKNYFSGQSVINVPEDLETVVFSNALLQMHIPDLRFSNNSIKKLIAVNNLLYTWGGPIGPFPKLKFLDLSSNNCNNISTSFFDQMINIEDLRISKNLLGFQLWMSESEDVFTKLKQLKAIDLSSNRIRGLTYNLFKNQSKLETLNLSDNSMKIFNMSIKHMTRLKFLDLSRNHFLNSFSDNFTSAIDDIKKHQPNLTINIMGNQLECSCEQLETLKWFLLNQNMFKYFINNSCILPNKTTISFRSLKPIVSELIKTCPNYFPLIMIVFGIVSVVMAIIIGGIVYRYRWKIRYMYYTFRSNNQLPVSKDIEFENIYDFDAFVSYSEEQNTFVTKDMILKLEEKHGLRLNIHQRDFVPGKDIATNITSSIQRSRKTIIILSRNFLKSKWCMFEFNMARMEEIYSREETNSMLFLILFETIPVSKMSHQILEVVERQSYIEYPNEEQGNVVFWDKVARSLMKK